MPHLWTFCTEKHIYNYIWIHPSNCHTHIHTTHIPFLCAMASNPLHHTTWDLYQCSDHGVIYHSITLLFFHKGQLVLFSITCLACGKFYNQTTDSGLKVGILQTVIFLINLPETTCRQLSKRLPNNSTIFAAEATAITLALNYYRHVDPVQHDVVVYSDSMSCLQAIEGEDTDNPLICQIMNLLWALSDKGTCVRFCWVPSHCGIEGNEIVDQLAKETLDHDIDPLTTVHFGDLKPLVNSYIQQEVQIKWDVSIHGSDLYLLKPTLGPPKRFRHLARAEEVVITRLRIGYTRATKSHILSRGPPTACPHCGQTLTIEHILLYVQCTVLQQSRDEYYTVDSLRTLFETIPEACII